MNSKPTRSFFVALSATVLLVPLGAGAATSAFQPASIPHPGSPTGNLYEDPASFAEGQTIKLTANFTTSAANEVVTLYRESPAGSNDYASTGKSDQANSYGNAYINYEVTGDQKVFARAANGEVTEIDTLNPVPSSALLDPNIAPAGVGGEDARAKATFEPAQSGKSASLQVKSIKDGSWDTIETGTQNSEGVASFYISDPLEVKHQYRAVSNGLATTNSVTWAGPLLNKDTGLATVHFNSNDGESVNTRTKYFKGEFAMKGGAFDCKNEGVFKDPTKPVVAEMKGRGNYSWSFAKKSFTLKLDKGKDLCEMGDSKKWALVANHYDRSLLRNAVAYHLGKKFTNLVWSPDQQPVDLYVNGSYRGSYTLVERITATGNDSPSEGGRIPIPELEGNNPDHNTAPGITGGYILEWDFRHDADTNFDLGTRGWIGVKEPEDPEDPEGISNAQFNYIRNYTNQADDALFGSNFKDDQNGWKKYIDQASAVDYYIAMEFLKPVDGNMWASVYMYKPVNGKLRMGPLWDFDLAAGSADRAGNVVSPSSWYLRNSLGVSAMQSSKTWFNRLNEDPDFRAAVRTRWNQVDQNLDPSVFIGTMRGAIADSAAENYKKWSHGSKISQYQVIKSSWSADVNYLESWADSRRTWMNSQLDNGD